MPARIVVEEGPDKGRTFVISDRATEVRLGRGPGMTISFTDPSWQGTIRITPRKAGYVVTNDMTGAIYLGDGELPRGQERTWYHGEQLQPTPETVLILLNETVEKPGPATKNVEETSVGGNPQKSRQLAYIAIRPPPRDPVSVRVKINNLTVRLFDPIYSDHHRYAIHTFDPRYLEAGTNDLKVYAVSASGGQFDQRNVVTIDELCVGVATAAQLENLLR